MFWHSNISNILHLNEHWFTYQFDLMTQRSKDHSKTKTLNLLQGFQSIYIYIYIYLFSLQLFQLSSLTNIRKYVFHLIIRIFLTWINYPAQFFIKKSFVIHLSFSYTIITKTLLLNIKHLLLISQLSTRNINVRESNCIVNRCVIENLWSKKNTVISLCIKRSPAKSSCFRYKIINDSYQKYTIAIHQYSRHVMPFLSRRLI